MRSQHVWQRTPRDVRNRPLRLHNGSSFRQDKREQQRLSARLQRGSSLLLLASRRSELCCLPAYISGRTIDIPNRHHKSPQPRKNPLPFYPSRIGAKKRLTPTLLRE